MKKTALILALLMICLSFAACGGEDAPAETPAPTESSVPAESETEATEPAESTPEVTETAAPHEHVYDGKWEKNSDHHWKVCSVCEQSEIVGEHEFSLVLVEKEPTESEDGVGYFVCDVCGILEEKPIPAGSETDNG